LPGSRCPAFISSQVGSLILFESPGGFAMTVRTEVRTVPVVWILVADRRAARIYAATWPGLRGFVEKESLIHPEGALHGRDMHPDRFGLSHAPDGHGFTNAPQTDDRHFTAGVFAAHIIERLEKGRTDHEFGRLIVFAPPLMLGELRERLSTPLQQLIESDDHKDLVQASNVEVLEHGRQTLLKSGRR
jgi:protein required for attachment to host cells